MVYCYLSGILKKFRTILLLIKKFFKTKKILRHKSTVCVASTHKLNG